MLIKVIQSSNSSYAEAWANENGKNFDLVLHRPDYCGFSNVNPCSIAEWIDFGFLMTFACEMLLKMIALGLCGYLDSGWNWIDMIVVISGMITLVFSDFPVVGTLRLVRMLRPLRSIQRIRGMRVLVQCILVAAPQIVRAAAAAAPHTTPLSLSLAALRTALTHTHTRAPSLLPARTHYSATWSSSSSSSSLSSPSSAWPSSGSNCATHAMRSRMVSG